MGVAGAGILITLPSLATLVRRYRRLATALREEAVREVMDD